jgi:hypothetical protein
MNNMKLRCPARDAPDWFKKFATAELQCKFLTVAGSTTEIPDMRKIMLDVYNQKGITAWYGSGYGITDDLWIEVDLNTPEWTFRMLKYEGATC